MRAGAPLLAMGGADGINNALHTKTLDRHSPLRGGLAVRSTCAHRDPSRHLLGGRTSIHSSAVGTWTIARSRGLARVTQWDGQAIRRRSSAALARCT
mmetsp:Transcript_23348/g.67591  ORF Transcript_23348/g.67591 Transcript_23348/m.67591 type:complete len:97 (-) Transcript_23348:27-317(-)